MDLNELRNDPQIQQMAQDVATLQPASLDHYLGAIANAAAPIDVFYRQLFSSMRRAFIVINRCRRREKMDRKRRRHTFLAHGKHGVKRPRGKRNAPKWM